MEQKIRRREAIANGLLYTSTALFGAAATDGAELLLKKTERKQAARTKRQEETDKEIAQCLGTYDRMHKGKALTALCLGSLALSTAAYLKTK